MAQAGVDPVINNPSDAHDALERDLPRALKGRSLEETGWKRVAPLTLLVPVLGTQPNVDLDAYLLRLGFDYYPEWPPSAQFVNPVTQAYNFESDRCWLPKIEGCSEIQVHADYNGNGKRLQLICCSTTLEFYLIRHGVEPRHLWDPAKQNFSATINQIEWALRSPFYKGRQHALPP